MNSIMNVFAQGVTVALVLVTLICLLIPIYTYLAYPALLWLLTRFRRPTPVWPEVTVDNAPAVTLVISCYNEVAVIAEKLDNALALDYPVGQLSIVVVSDGSDDGTDEVVREYRARGVNLIRQEGRLGKTMGLNLAMLQITSPVVVFSDANALYAPDAISQLVRHFADPQVGYVVGAALYTDGDTTAAAASEHRYWCYELAIKQWESQLHSVVGGDGAIYAIRRSLWQRLDARDINDFVNPLQIIASGYRGRFEPKARCFEKTAGTFAREAARKERIVNRSVRGLMRVRAVMNPWRFGLFSWQVISHKLLRWLIPLFALVGLLGSIALAAQGWWLFQALLWGAAGLLLLATLGGLLQHRAGVPALFSLPYYLLLVNWYALRGIISALRGHTQVTWQGTRAEGNSLGHKLAAPALDQWLMVSGLAFGAVLLVLAMRALLAGWFHV